MNEFFSLASCNSRNSPANKARSAWPVVCILAWSWLHGCAWKPFMRFEMIFSEWILDSFFSGILDSKSWILDSNAQYSGFHKQKFPGFRNPDYLTWGDLFYRVCWVTSNKGKAVRVMVLKNGKNNSLMKWYVPLAYLLLWRHYTTILDTAVKVTTWGLRSIMSRRLCSSVIFVFHSCFLYYHFIKDLMFYFQDSSFFDSWSNPWSNPISKPWSDRWSGP